jgi:hypothetical protein
MSPQEVMPMVGRLAASALAVLATSAGGASTSNLSRSVRLAALGLRDGAAELAPAEAALATGFVRRVLLDADKLLDLPNRLGVGAPRFPHPAV